MQRYTVGANLNGGLSERPIFEGTESTSFPPRSHLRDIDDAEISIFNKGGDQEEKKKTSTVTLNLDRITDRCDVSMVSRLPFVSSDHETPTASSEASRNNQSSVLSIPPGSVSVSTKDLPLDEKRRGSSIKWLFGARCPCSGKKSVQVEEKLSNPKSPFHSNCDSNSSLNPKKQSYRAEEGALNRGVPKEKAAKLIEKNMMIDERRELKSVTGNHLSSDSSLVLQENHSSSSECGGPEVVSQGRAITDGGSFSFPILNPPPRESLEIFKPTDELVERKSTELQRRILMSFTGEIDQQSFTFPASPSPKTRAATATDDDVASDTSSDLFEIESFSTQTTMYPLNRRKDSFDKFLSSNDGRGILGNDNGKLQFRRGRSLDGTMNASSITPTECYELSKVSIDWNVATAEGFDRGSDTDFSTTMVAASEYENVRFIIQKESEKDGNGGGAVTNIRRKVNGLLNCRCEKAVSTVGPHPPVKPGPDHQCHCASAFGTQ
ncbi:protein PHYTOCHROME KINASE SUBSTRATE 4-like [Macadamia integrifolia]|uniref:protein PHYTOCHROME KINASE SUBSTRATE 4-like n=1 Tax=Macadamia integrifolia TaxID=60698 RepID=UPI001C527718|nr:protein PHYTOCHROME KINASE SUBSTRATE 4-like [Macadamia integrifolia]